MTNLLELFPEFLNAPVSIYTLLHIALNCMAHKDMLRNIVHAILVAQPGEGMAAVMRSVLGTGGRDRDTELIQFGIKKILSKFDGREISRDGAGLHKRKHCAVNRNDTILTGSSLDAAFEISFREIYFDLLKSADSKPAVNHDKNHLRNMI